MAEEVVYSIFSRNVSAELMKFGKIVALILICIVVAIAFFVYLWKLKEKRDESVFTVTRESIGEQSEKIRNVLLSLNATKRESVNALLLLEEIVVRLHENANQIVTARVKKIFGDVSITLTSNGEEYNPFSPSLWDTESEDYYRDMIFRANIANLGYSRKNRRNVISLRVHSANSRAMYFTFGAMIFGLAFGFLMKQLPETASIFISDKILSTIQTIFMNALSLLLAPVVFFSVATSISKLSSGSEIGRIGGKVLGTYALTTIIAILVGFALFAIFFNTSLPPLPESFATDSEKYASNSSVSISEFLIDIIPKNFVSPIQNGNMMQVLFVAVFTGIALSALGEKVQNLKLILEDANELFLKMMTMVIAFMPFIAFSAMAKLLYSSSASSLLTLLVYLIAIIFGCLIMWFVYSIIILIIGRISPIQYIKKSIIFSLTPFSIASSSACIPLTLEFCKKKLGIHEKIASFSIPLGATVNMDGGCLSMPLAVLMLAKMSGIEIDSSTLLQIGFMTFLLSVGAPGIPGSAIICIATMLPTIGIPSGAVAFVVGVEQIVTRLRTVSNINGDIAAAVLVSASENEIDKKIYEEK